MLLAAGALAAVGISLAACGGGSDKVAAGKWVDKVCSLAADYKKTTDAQGDKLMEVDPDKDPKGAKTALLAAFDEVGKAQDTFKSGLGKAGEPDLASGADVVKAFNAHMDASKKELKDAKSKLDKLDTGSKTFSDDLGQILEGVDTKDFRDELQAVVDKKPDAQEIMDGIDANSACADVLFKSGSSAASGKSTPTTTAKTTPRPSSTQGKSSTPVARTTPKANASKNEKWVIGLCVATQSYVDDIETISNNIDLNKTGGDNQKLKDVMVKFMQDARDRSQQFKTDVDKLPAPDVKDGAKIQSSMSNAANQVVTLFNKALTDAKALDATSTQKLSNGLAALGESLSSASNDISGAFDDIDTKYDTTELSKIARNVPECGGFFN